MVAKAKFVSDDEKTERFKYFKVLTNKYKPKHLKLQLKRYLKTLLSYPKLWVARLDWKAVQSESTAYIVEAGIEGFTANFATHFLLGVPFNVFTVFAHGFAIKQLLSIWWRVKQNGSTPTLPSNKH